jgi:Bacterial protein of unknown function (DUF937)
VLCFNSGLQSGQPVSDPTIGVNSLISAASKSICLYPEFGLSAVPYTAKLCSSR